MREIAHRDYCYAKKVQKQTVIKEITSNLSKVHVTRGSSGLATLAISVQQ